MPVSLTENAITGGAWLEHRMVRAPAAGRDADVQPHAAVLGELERVGQQVLQDLHQPLGVGDDRAPEVRLEAGGESRACGSRPRGGSCARPSPAGARTAAPRDSTVTVPDSIFDRSRMSLIRFSRSVPAPWMVLANSTCLTVRLPVGVLGQLLAQNQDAVERRAQLVRHVGQELGLVPRRQRQLRGLLFQRAAGLLDFLVLALDLGVLLGQLARLGGQLLVGLLQLLLLRLQFAGQLLRLLQQALGAHRGLDGVEHDADAAGQLLEERQVRRGERVQRGQLDHRLDLAFEEHRQHDDVARAGLDQARADSDRVAVECRPAGLAGARARTGRPGPRRAR